MSNTKLDQNKVLHMQSFNNLISIIIQSHTPWTSLAETHYAKIPNSRATPLELKSHSLDLHGRNPLYQNTQFKSYTP